MVIGSDGAVAEDMMDSAPTASYGPDATGGCCLVSGMGVAGRRLADEDVFWQEC